MDKPSDAAVLAYLEGIAVCLHEAYVSLVNHDDQALCECLVGIDRVATELWSLYPEREVEFTPEVKGKVIQLRGRDNHGS